MGLKNPTYLMGLLWSSNEIIWMQALCTLWSKCAVWWLWFLLQPWLAFCVCVILSFWVWALEAISPPFFFPEHFRKHYSEEGKEGQRDSYIFQVPLCIPFTSVLIMNNSNRVARCWDVLSKWTRKRLPTARHPHSLGLVSTISPAMRKSSLAKL